MWPNSHHQKIQPNFQLHASRADRGQQVWPKYQYWEGVALRTSCLMITMTAILMGLGSDSSHHCRCLHRRERETLKLLHHLNRRYPERRNLRHSQLHRFFPSFDYYIIYFLLFFSDCSVETWSRDHLQRFYSEHTNGWLCSWNAAYVEGSARR